MKTRKKLVAAVGIAMLVGASVVGIVAPAQAATTSVDVLGFCKSQFGAQWLVGTTVNPSDAYSWRCTYAGVPLPYGIDMNAACRWKTHLSYAYATVGNPSNAYSWVCHY